ncbi:MAG TPA: PfkB family carbohydrate kinase [Candidatus Saccharimonadales bacterium]|nr:PfkB family carbohydrate kinase [Candidatus Saccharimonadales bacterium]
MVEILAIGHTAKDEFPDGSTRLGGSALYAAATAARLGATTTLVTRVGPAERPALDALCNELGVRLHALPSDVTTTFAFRYDDDGRRHLRLRARAAELSLADLPASLHGADAVVFGTIARELDESLFGTTLARVEVLVAQGFLRGWTADGDIIPRPCDAAATIIPRVTATVVSDEDGADTEAWARAGTIVVTHAERGSDVLESGRAGHIHAFAAARIVDPTGAGDAFAAGLAVGLGEGLAIHDAALFASAVASFAVEGPATTGLADRARVDARLRD